MPRPALAAVALALVGAAYLQWSGADPPVQRPRNVGAWLGDAEQIQQWQAKLKREGVERLLIGYDPGNVLERIGLDTDRDERTDLVGIYRGGKLVRMARDQNRDNRVDEWVLLERNGIEERRLESDRNSDGIVDTWTVIDQAGVIQMVESDTNGDGRIDTWESYSEGQLKEIASDNDGSGRPEQWEHYSGPGKLIRIEYDLDGDGKADSSLTLSGAG